MALTEKQDRLYWQIWAKLAAAIAAADPDLTKKEIAAGRLYQHKAAHCPESHKDWRSIHLTRWLAHADIVADPTDLAARLRMEEALNDNAPMVYLLQKQLKAMGQDLAYAAGCVPGGANLPQDPRKWPADALKIALSALKRTHRRAQMPGKPPF